MLRTHTIIDAVVSKRANKRTTMATPRHVRLACFTLVCASGFVSSSHQQEYAPCDFSGSRVACRGGDNELVTVYVTVEKRCSFKAELQVSVGGERFTKPYNVEAADLNATENTYYDYPLQTDLYFVRGGMYDISAVLTFPPLHANFTYNTNITNYSNLLYTKSVSTGVIGTVSLGNNSCQVIQPMVAVTTSSANGYRRLTTALAVLLLMARSLSE